jgi:uncharacterized protein (UPF0548 family)
MTTSTSVVILVKVVVLVTFLNRPLLNLVLAMTDNIRVYVFVLGLALGYVIGFVNHVPAIAQ